MPNCHAGSKSLSQPSQRYSYASGDKIAGPYYYPSTNVHACVYSHIYTLSHYKCTVTSSREALCSWGLPYRSWQEAVHWPYSTTGEPVSPWRKICMAHLLIYHLNCQYYYNCVYGLNCAYMLSWPRGVPQGMSLNNVESSTKVNCKTSPWFFS